MNQPVQVRGTGGNNEAIMLLRGILEKQNEQTALLQALVQRQNAGLRQNAQWKKENPELAKRCGAATKRGQEHLAGLIERLVEALEDLREDDNWDANYALFELIDKYGHKLQQFGVIISTLTQLGTE